MTKSRLFLSIVVIIAGAMTLTIYLLPTSGPRVTKANFDRIGQGMTYHEVELVLGMPDDASWAAIIPVCNEARITWSAKDRSWDDGSWAKIEFIDGRVNDKKWYDSNK